MKKGRYIGVPEINGFRLISGSYVGGLVTHAEYLSRRRGLVRVTEKNLQEALAILGQMPKKLEIRYPHVEG